MAIRTATGLIAGYMRTRRFAGWASLWGTIYVLPGHENDQRPLRHERKYLEQIESDGQKESVRTLAYTSNLKEAENVAFGEVTTSGDVPIVGDITIKDATGVIRKLGVVS